MKKMLLIVVTNFVLVAIAGPAAAQSRFGASNAEVGVSYAFLRDDGENATLGMVFDVARRVKGPVSLMGEIGLNRFTDYDENLFQVGGGVRLEPRSGRRVRPFVQTVVGTQRVLGETGFNVQPGGGAHVGLSRRVDAKLQVDLPIVRWEGDTYRQFRFSTGLGVALGRVAN